MALTKVSRGLLSTGIVDNSNATAITIDSSENVGIGVSTAYTGGKLSVNGGIVQPSGAQNVIGVYGTSGLQVIGVTGGDNVIGTMGANEPLVLRTGSSERMRINSLGHLTVGTTDDAPGAGNTLKGVAIRGGSDNRSFFAVNGAYVMHLNRNTNEGNILHFSQNGTVVGTINATGGDLAIGTGDCGIRFNDSANAVIPFNITTNAQVDNTLDLGYPTLRWNDIYATNGTIQTSDRNEKQDIAELSDAEQRVALACKGLLRKFRWIDAVEAKGDDARIHFGIIAQDLQAAFEAEGLDAGRYAMFMSNTWWETQTEVAAVEAVEATEDTEAIEAVDAYTRTDTYDTAEEAPEGATERTRLGVRYSELLAFIIAVI